MSKSGIEFVFAAFAVVFIVSLFTGALDPSPRPCLALTSICLSSMAAAGIYPRLVRDRKQPKVQLIIMLLIAFSTFTAGVTGAIYPRDSRVETPYLSGLFALASLIFAGYSVRQYIKKTRP